MALNLGGFAIFQPKLLKKTAFDRHKQGRNNTPSPSFVHISVTDDR